MIIPIINQKHLTSDTSQQEIARVRTILDQNGIEYYVKTSSKSGGSIAMGRRMDVAASRVMAYNTSVDSVGMVYILYVKRKDYARACALMRKDKGIR